MKLSNYKDDWLLKLGAAIGFLAIIGYVAANIISYKTSESIIKDVNAIAKDNIPALVLSADTNLWKLSGFVDRENESEPVALSEVAINAELFKDKLLTLENYSKTYGLHSKHALSYQNIFSILDETKRVIYAHRLKEDFRLEKIKNNFNEASRLFRIISADILRNDQSRMLTATAEIRSQQEKLLISSGVFVFMGCLMILLLIFDLFRRQELLDKALSADRMKSSFFAMMSHEIRTPINGIMGNLALLSESGLNTAQQNFVNTAHSSADGLLTIINDVLDYSKIEAGKLEINESHFDIQELMKNISDLLQPLAKSKNLELYCVIDPDLPRYLYADPARVRQIILNFASNAIKFTQSGFIRLEALVENRSNLTGPHKYIRFSVIDSGMGINEKAQALLFREFSQVDGSHTRRFEGTGLGLAICKRLAEMMKGGVGVKSVEGAGSTFWFLIPIHEKPLTALSNLDTAPSEIKTSRPAHILLAEDNVTNLMIAMAFLQKAGHTIETASNGQELLERAQKSKNYDLILTDISMPIMDGFEAVQKIRALGGQIANVPIIAMTAYALQGDRDACLKAGMNDYLSKPISKNTLLAMVSKWMPACENFNQSPQPEKIDMPEPEHEISDDYFNQIVNDLGQDGAHNFAQIFIDDLKKTAANMLKAAEDKNWEKTKINAHSLKSSALSFGLIRISKLAEAIEASCKKGSAADKELLTQWEQRQNAAIAALKQRFTEMGLPIA